MIRTVVGHAAHAGSLRVVLNFRVCGGVPFKCFEFFLLDIESALVLFEFRREPLLGETAGGDAQ